MSQNGDDDGLTQLINQKLLTLIGNQPIPHEVQQQSNEQRLKLLFKFYQQDTQFYEHFVEAINQQNAELKVRQIELQDQLAELEQKLIDALRHKQTTQISRQRYTHPKQTFTQQQKNKLMAIFKQKQQQVTTLKKRCQQLESEVHKLSHEKTAIQTKLSSQQQQVQNQRNNLTQFQQQIHNLESTITTLQRQNEENRVIYETKFLQEFQKAVNNIRDNETSIRLKEKTNYQKKIKELQESLKTVVNSINDLLSISVSTSGQLSPEEQQRWIAQVQSAAKRHLKQVNKYVRSNMRQSTECTLGVTDLARLQKQKITGRRMYLVNALLSDNK